MMNMSCLSHIKANYLFKITLGCWLIFGTSSTVFAANILIDDTPCLYAAEQEQQITQNQNMSVFAPCPGGADVIGGKAYRDFSFDGMQNALEPAQEGIEVFLFACDANDESVEAAASTVTGTEGEYFFSGLDPAVTYRVEFVIPEALNFLGFTTFGPENGTNVQYTTPGTCDISVGVGYEAEFHQDNPFIATPCYINGSGNPGTQTGSQLAFLAVEYEADGTNQNIELFTAEQVGSLWGVAYERSTQTIISSAVLRRHMGFGPGGTGALYFMDVSDITNPSVEGILDLDALGFNTGPDPRIDTPLPDDLSAPNHDTEAFSLTAKMSLGDTDISDDGKTLYTVNLLTRELITVDLTDFVLNGTFPGAAQVTSTPIPAFNCDNDADWRPWGLKFRQGKLFLGGVCSAETSQDAASLTATVVEYDGTNFTEVFTFPLDFERGDPFNTDADPQNQRNQWYPWSDDYTIIRTDPVNGRFAYPQPILSDIEFDTDGSMILGFLDRTAQQGGFLNYGPDESDLTLYSTFSAGDIIRVCNAGGTFELEGSSAACTTPLGVNFPQGPNGQEYYWEEQFPPNPTGDPNAFIIHAEIALGALTLLPGTGDITATVFDPLLGVDAGGISWFDNATGGRDRNYQVFIADGGVGFPGKSNGLGDLDLVCTQAPSEIGNYAWIDCNGDGIQDPCEDPLEGLNVSLYKADGTLVDTEITNAAGQYYFNSTSITESNTSADTEIISNTTYYIVFGDNGQYNNSTGITTVGGTEYQLTAANTGQAPNNDLNDSDAEEPGAGAPAFVQGLQAVTYIAPCTGFVSHNIDAGFASGAIEATAEVTPTTCPAAVDGQIVVNATSSGGGTFEYSLNGGAFQASNTFTGLAAGTYTVDVQIAGGGASGGCGGDGSVTVMIEDGDNPLAPETTDFSVCMGDSPNAGEGLTATCTICTDNTGATTTPVVTWWDAPTGGTQLSTGEVFDPVASGDADNNTFGTTTFYAQCECGVCISDRAPASFIVVANPTPQIVGNEMVCPEGTETYTVNPLNPSSTFVWEVLTGGIEIVGPNDETVVEIAVLGEPGSGPYQLKVTETGPDPSCMGMDILDITVKEIALICNDAVNVTLDDNGCAFVAPDLILEGVNADESCYDVEVTNQYGESFGNKVTCENIGQALTVTVTSVCTQNSCWSTVIPEDKTGPVIDCPTGLTTVDCTFDIEDIPFPTATDNCSGVVPVNLADEMVDDSDICGPGVLITRVYVALDEEGNISEPCEQEILIELPDLPVFPGDITWNCDQYAAYPNITDATPLAEFVPDNDLTTPDVIDVPFWLSQETLAETGSGILDIQLGEFCNYAVSFEDDSLSVCTGFKIIRTWTVLNWCSGEIILTDANGQDNEQVIKVTDSRPPEITGDDFTVNANIPGDHPVACRSTEEIPVPEVWDNCGAVLLYIYTPVGEADYANGVDATDGASIPSPGLDVGVHDITFVAVDDCENITTVVYQVTVADMEVPTMICDEITNVVLNSVGENEVAAEIFDDGTHDNCCLDYFEVKRVSEPLTAFSPSVLFTCEDVNDTVMVMLRATDCYENSATCTIEVRIEDKEFPTCIAPPDVTISCIDVLDNNIDFTDEEGLEEEFGSAQAFDNCEAEFQVLDSENNLGPCGGGTVIRRFLPVDNQGNEGAVCEQTINVIYQPDYKLTFPPDYEGECGVDPAEPNVIIESDACDLIAVSHTDQIFNLSDDGACYKIIRRYEVINWCTHVVGAPGIEFSDDFSSMSGEMVTEATFNNAGFLIYSQTLKIVDNEAPELSFEGETEFCVNDECVEAEVSLPFIIDENCTSELDIIWSLDADSDGTIEATGAGEFNGTAPLGDHILIYTVTDGCGNSESLDVPFSVVDCKAPTVYCNGITIGLMATTPPMVEIWASDLDAGSHDNCGGPVTAAFSSNPLDTGLVLTCENIGANQIELYIIDEAGNYDYCITTVNVQDFYLQSIGQPCVAPDDPTIAGTITTETGEGLEGAIVELNGDNQNPINTDATGEFAFTGVTAGGDYTIVAQHDVDHDNGVTVYDLTLIKAHVLNINPIVSPFKLIAADANNSQSVTTSDIVALRRLILSLDDELSNNSSWRFVEAGYVFPDPQNPWAEDFPEIHSINNFSEAVDDADFIAVKIGDINGNAAANLQGNAEERNIGTALKLGVKDAEFSADDLIEVEVTARNYSDISAYQFTLNFSQDVLVFKGIKETEYVTEADFGTKFKNQGILTVAHSDEVAKNIPSGEVLFTLEFKAIAGGLLAESLSLSSEKTKAVAYQGSDFSADAMSVEFDFTAVANEFTLYQNRPNPFTETTTVPFFLPEAGKAELRIFDVNGKLLKFVSDEYAAGYHQILISQNELGTGSVFYYQLDTDNQSAARKMVKLK